ncbi:MAG: DMT family transporter [Bacteroidia bacterium]|nr:DMT family transporter [Bacteroidia bacterium]MDW8235243.1 DMT family transporter [Bacteroidia bacterium]
MRSAKLTTKKKTWRGHLFLSMQTAIICGGYVVGREAAVRLDPLFLTGLRAFGSAVIFAVLWRPFQSQGWIGFRWAELPRRDKVAVFKLAALGILFNQLLFNWGLRYTTAATTALIYALTPSVVYALSIWFFRKEKLLLSRIGALLLIYAGVVLALWHNLLHGTHGWGWLLILTAVGFWAWYLHLSPPVLEKHGSIGITAVIMIVGGLMHLPTLGIGLLRQNQIPLSPATWGSLGYLILGMSVASYLLLNAGLKYLSPTQVALYISLQPVGTTLLSALLGQEPLTWQLALAAALSTIGLILFQR